LGEGVYTPMVFGRKYEKGEEKKGDMKEIRRKRKENGKLRVKRFK
jgi:hypothetical protein